MIEKVDREDGSGGCETEDLFLSLNCKRVEWNAQRRQGTALSCALLGSDGKNGRHNRVAPPESSGIVGLAL